MKFNYKTSSDKIYLDEIQTLHKSIETYLKKIDLDTLGSGCDNWLNELECRRRDGFIPHSHNHGGFDVYNTHSSEFECYCNEPESCECDSTIILHGFRLMYEGQSSGIHTMCVYYAQWSEYDCYGMSKADTIAEIEIKFKTAKTLMTKLEKFINKTLAE